MCHGLRLFIIPKLTIVSIFKKKGLNKCAENNGSMFYGIILISIIILFTILYSCLKVIKL